MCSHQDTLLLALDFAAAIAAAAAAAVGSLRPAAALAISLSFVDVSSCHSCNFSSNFGFCRSRVFGNICRRLLLPLLIFGSFVPAAGSFAFAAAASCCSLSRAF